MEHIELKEIIELFLISTVKEIKDNDIVPNINFEFNEDGLRLFEEVKNSPFKKQDYWTPDIKQEDIDYLLNNLDDVLTIKVDEPIAFFNYLKDIINELIKLHDEYNETKYARNLALYVTKHIWLRMGIEDFNNVNEFLKKQLEFVKNRTFDTHKKEKISDSIEREVVTNMPYDETTRRMVFTIKRNGASYELPHILYDIDDSNICYIYAVQSSKNKSAKDKKIERELYRLNKGIENPNVHPSKVYSLMLFFNELKKKGISKVRVPSMQVLSYDYHEILSIQAKENLDDVMQRLQNPENTVSDEELEYVSTMYNNMYQKQDKISFLKTEELINLMYRSLDHNPSIEILNDINVQGDYLSLKL